jgi:molybdopterin-containing oxidoreductase family iron-sulfur binding subunit
VSQKIVFNRFLPEKTTISNLPKGDFLMTDILVTMQHDLERSLLKNPQERRWAMLIDLRKCVGCFACTIGCISENKLPPKMTYRPVFEYEQGTYPKPSRTFLPKPCMQCDKPPCVDSCPVKKGTVTRKETKGIGAGIVVMNYEECLGCGKCVPKCPYESRTMDKGTFHTAEQGLQKYEIMPNFEYEKSTPRVKDNSPINNARKCHFCLHRLAVGQLPMCITTCIGRAGYFGDENDPKSLIAEVKKSHKIQILKAGKKTEPRVYYIANENLEVLYGK